MSRIIDPAEANDALENVGGKYFYADARNDAWHGLGQGGLGLMTVDGALDAAYMRGWNVRKVPLWADISGDEGKGVGLLPVPNMFAVVRDNPITGNVEVMGDQTGATAGKRFCPVQNEATVELLTALCDAYGIPAVETIGSLNNGSKTFVSMLIPHEMNVAGLQGDEGERLEYYLVVINHHDGSGKLKAIVTATRPVCRNTLTQGENQAVSCWGVSHTVNANTRLQVIRETLGLSYQWINTLEEEIAALLDKPVHSDEARDFAEWLVELEDAPSPIAESFRRNTSGQIHKLFVESPTIVGTPSEGNAYGLYGAVTEYVDHFQRVRGSGEDRDKARLIRAARTMDLADGRVSLKTKALDRLLLV